MRALRVASPTSSFRSLARTTTRKPTNPVSVEPGPAHGGSALTTAAGPAARAGVQLWIDNRMFALAEVELCSEVGTVVQRSLGR